MCVISARWFLVALGIGSGDYFELRGFDDSGVEYWDSQTKRKRSIWSIGKHKETGKIIASYSSDLYGDDRYECIWLR
jgi:hypothetical protein